MEQSLNASAKIHERAEVRNRYHASGEHRAGHDRLAQLGGTSALLHLELLATRDHDVFPPIPVLDDAERINLSDVLRRICGADDVDLCEGAERPFSGLSYFVATFDDFLNLPFDREPGLKRVLELALRGGVAHAPARQHDAAARGDNHGLDAIAH